MFLAIIIAAIGFVLVAAVASDQFSGRGAGPHSQLPPKHLEQTIVPAVIALLNDILVYKKSVKGNPDSVDFLHEQIRVMKAIEEAVVSFRSTYSPLLDHSNGQFQLKPGLAIPPVREDGRTLPALLSAVSSEFNEAIRIRRVLTKVTQRWLSFVAIVQDMYPELSKGQMIDLLEVFELVILGCQMALEQQQACSVWLKSGEAFVPLLRRWFTTGPLTTMTVAADDLPDSLSGKVLFIEGIDAVMGETNQERKNQVFNHLSRLQEQNIMVFISQQPLDELSLGDVTHLRLQEAFVL